MKTSAGPVPLANNRTPGQAHITSAGPIEHRFSPYDFNGGTVVAVAGPDYCVFASDTRLSSGYEIKSRNVRKWQALTDKCILASAGCKTDVDQLRNVLDYRMKVSGKSVFPLECCVWQDVLPFFYPQMYQYNSRQEMATPAVAQMLSTILYQKRMFPYYAFNVLGGIDNDGKGYCTNYDAIGSYERTQYASAGSGESYLVPILDNVLGQKNQQLKAGEALTAQQVVEILQHAFLAIGERDIYTGDTVECAVVTAAGIETIRTPLKAD